MAEVSGSGGSGTGGAEVTGSEIVSEAEKFAGYPYVYGAAGPTSFDCSGLVQYTLEQLGWQDVPRTSEEQWAWVNRIGADKVGPGDLVFAQFPGDNASPGHVGVYVGNGRVISAQDPALGVGYSSLASWEPNIVGYGHVPASNITATGTGATGGGGGDGSVIPAALSGALSGLYAGLTGQSDSFAGTDPLTAIGAGITALATEFESANKILTWLTLPSNWTRIFAGVLGAGLLGGGIYMLTKEAGT
jgi:hypothetical protein